MLGSQFVAHPPIQPFTVSRSAEHPLVAGIEPFEADDEIYLCRFFGEHVQGVHHIALKGKRLLDTALPVESLLTRGAALCSRAVVHGPPQW